MSKQDNLTDFLTNVADAIREKKGTTEKINPQNFATEIKSLLAERPSVEWNDVNFYDYDGTRLYSYSWEEAIAMTELPPLPTQKGLICQEWNYTLEDIKAQSGRCDIGATYITDDGKTRFYLTIDSERAKDMWLYLSASVSGGIVIDWGDGTVETPTGTTLSLNHKYAEFGNYVVAIEVKSGILKFRGINNEHNTFGSCKAPSFERLGAVKKIEIGSGITDVGHNAFSNSYNLEYATIPAGVTTLNGRNFSVSKLKCLIIPNGVTTLNSDNFTDCYNLLVLSLPNSITQLGSNAIYNCKRLEHIVIPESVVTMSKGTLYFGESLITVHMPSSTTSLPEDMLRTCKSLPYLSLPRGLKSIGPNALYNCTMLQKLLIPEEVMTIEGGGLQFLTRISYIDFSQHKAIPTLVSNSSLGRFNSNGKIIVPDDLYNEWIAATNWSTLASNIVKNSEYTRPI